MNTEKNEKLVKYYQFDNGKIIMKDFETLLFYELNENGEWVVSGNIMAKFYDAASEYVEITKEEVEGLLLKGSVMKR